MTSYLIDIRRAGRSRVFNELEEALIHRALSYKASNLWDKGFETPEGLRRAVARAMRACRSAGIPVREHFKPVYVSDEAEHLVLQDWSLSKFAYLLVLLNAEKEHPLVSRLQVRLIRSFLGDR